MVRLEKETMELLPVNALSYRSEGSHYEVIEDPSSSGGGFGWTTTKTRASTNRSLALLVVGTTCLYSSVNANMNIISSVASDSGLGSVALLVYAVVQFFNALVGNHFMGAATSRRVLLGAMIALTIYGFLNVYISWGTLVVGAVFQGIGYSLQWIAGNTYTTELGLYYSRLVGVDEQVTLVRMFGLFNFAVQGGFVWGNLAVYLILPSSQVDQEQVSFLSVNQTVYTEELGISNCRMCGPSFRAENAALLPQMARPPAWRLYLLEGVFGLLSVIGVFMIARMEDFGSKDYASTSTMMTCKGFWEPVKQMAYQVKDVRQLLLLPISILIGMEQAFVMAEYTKSFVSCCLGINSIGLVMLCFGAVDIAVCVGQEWIIRLTSRTFVLGVGLSSGAIALLTMLFWHPTPDDRVLYYVLAALWAFFDAILITQVFALYGLLFQDAAEVNFSLGIVCVAVGFLLQFSYSLAFSAGVKTSIMLAITLFSAISYSYLEFSLRSKTASKSTSQAFLSTDSSTGKMTSEENDIVP